MGGYRIIFVFLFTLCLIEQHDLTDSCLHSVLHGESETIAGMTVVTKDKSRKVKRSITAAAYTTRNTTKFIRIKPVYFLSKNLLPEEKLEIKKVVQRAISRIKSFLSVIHKVKGPLLLKRNNACPIVLKEGINKGKCSRIKKGYKGEYCLDNFRLPSNHLEGLAVFNATYADPIKVYKASGSGLTKTDFVLYITSEITAMCNPYKTSALAYAATCQVNGRGRPVAGQVNFCPRTLKTQKFDADLLYKTAIHEIFHTLGFSHKFFEKFASCDQEGTCSFRKESAIRSLNGTMRLMTPAVIREMKQHFDCWGEKDFGGPLHLVDGKVTSHWDPVLMHSSIMTAKEQKPYLSLIDPITLAVFEDSGWYKVNYSNADPFIWGLGEGCQFGMGKECKEQNGLCSSNKTGCHHLRLTKGKCNANPNVQQGGCGVFAADQKPCFTDTSKGTSSSHDETFTPTSRCFLSSLVPTNESQVSNLALTTGRCYESKCESGKVSVRVKGRDWILCQPGTDIQVENFDGFIECPLYEEICISFLIKDVPIALPASGISQKAASLMQPDEGEKDGKPLYVTVRISASFNGEETDAMEKTIYAVIKENKLLTSELSQTNLQDSVRICLSLEIPPHIALDRRTLADQIRQAVSKAYHGRYDRDISIAALTSRRGYCMKKHFYLDKRYRYGGGGGNAGTIYPSFFCIYATLVSSLFYSVHV